MKLVDGKLVPEGEEETAALKAMAEETAAGLKAKNSELLGKLKALDAHKDIDPNEYKTLKEQAAKIEEEKLLARGDFEAQRKKDFEAFTKERETFAKEREKLLASVESYALDSEIKSAIAAEGGYEIGLMPHVKQRMKLDENFKPMAIDIETGSIKLNKEGKPMTARELVAEMKTAPDFQVLYKPSGASGSGSQQSNGNNSHKKTMTREAWDQTSHVERSEFSKAGGQVVD